MPLHSFANAAYILRAANKDQYYISNLVQQVNDLSASLKGMHFTSNNDSYLNVLSNLLYILSTFLSGRQTIGEEYTDLIPVTTEGTRVKLFQKLRYVLFFVFEPYALKWFAQKYFPTHSSKEIAEHINTLHQGFFFLFGVYLTLPHRFSAVRLGALTPSRNPDGDTSGYRFMGILIVLQYLIRGVMAIRERGQQRAAAAASEAAAGRGADGSRREPGGEEGAGAGASETDSDEDPEDHPNGKCALCLRARKVPTATQCGHMFCWDCAVDWIHANQPSAHCPLCRQSVSVEGLVRLVGYKVPKRN